MCKSEKKAWLLIIGFLTILLISTSCRSSRPIVTKVDTAKDSTAVTKVSFEKVLDTLTVDADSLKINVPIKALSAKPILTQSKSGRTKASIRKVENNIEVECFTEKYEHIIESQNKIIETLIKLTETTTTEQTQIVSKSPWYTKALAWLGAAALFVGGVLAVSKLKPF